MLSVLIGFDWGFGVCIALVEVGFGLILCAPQRAEGTPISINMELSTLRASSVICGCSILRLTQTQQNQRLNCRREVPQCLRKSLKALRSFVAGS